MGTRVELKKRPLRVEESHKACIKCGITKGIHEFRKKLTTNLRYNQCMACQDGENEELISLYRKSKHTKEKRMKKANKLEAKFAANADTILSNLKAQAWLPDYLMASGVPKRELCKLLLGLGKGAVKVVGKIYFGGSYIKKTGMGASVKVETITLPEMKQAVIEAYNMIESPIHSAKAKLSGAAKVEEMFKAGLTVDQIEKFTRIKREKIEKILS